MSATHLRTATMPSNPARAHAVTIQIATKRRGIPHARMLRRWACAALKTAAKSDRVHNQQLCIRVVGNAESRQLNRNWRGKDYATNVLSFPHDHVAMLGDLAICAPVVAREARGQSKSLNAHWAHMVVHGVLHLLGYDHERERDARVMELLEKRLLKRWGIADPYTDQCE